MAARSPPLSGGATFHGAAGRGDDDWNDVSPEAYGADLDAARASLADLRRFDRAALGAEARLNVDLYAARLQQRIDGLALGAHHLSHNQRTGVQADWTIVAGSVFERFADYEALLARIERWPRKVERTIALLREAIAHGHLWPQVVMLRVRSQLERLDVAPERHPFFAPFRTLRARLSGRPTAPLRDAALAAIARHILPAQRCFDDFIAREYLPRAPLSAGLSRLPDGDALYAYFLRSHTSSELDAARIHAIGLEEVARIAADMHRVAQATRYSGTPRAGFDAMRAITDPGQACAYKLGQRAILQLRERAHAALGPAFDIRAFHATVLGAGSVPLDVLESRVRAWLAAPIDARVSPAAVGPAASSAALPA